MTKKILVLMFLLLTAIASPAQQTVKKDSGTITVSGAAVGVAGGAFQLDNSLGMVTNGFEVVITGTPSTVSVVTKGCMRGGTCDTLDTYTTVANANRKPTISVAYDYFEISASWTGGSSPTVRINRTATLARSGGGGAGGAVSSVFSQTGVVPDLSGDVTTGGSSVTTLSTTGASAASCGDATHSCSLTVDAKGRITANSNNVITGGGTVTHTAGNLTAGQIAIGNGAADITVGNLSGDISTSGGTVTALANIPTAVTAAGTVVHTNIAAPSSPAAGKDSIFTDSTDLRLHDKNASGVIGTTVVSDTGAANNFLTGITTAGAVTKAQPAFSNLSGSVAAGQMPALTGDVTMTAGQTATVVTNIPSAATAAGSIVRTNIAAPSSPAAGKDSEYSDSTDLRFHDKNASGVIGTTVVSDTGAANNFLTGITTAGAVTKAQPAFSNLSGSATTGQLPGSGATTVNGNTCTLGSTCTLSLDQISAAAASKTWANGNNPLTFNNAQTTDSQNGVAFGETTAATNGTLTNALANQAELKASTLTVSTATPLSVLQGSITGTVAFPLAQFQGTWNNASLTGMGEISNITDTQSAAGSLLRDWRTNNTSRFKIDKTGLATSLGGYASSGSNAGFFQCTQGSANGHATANTFTLECPAAVTAFEQLWLAGASSGVLHVSNASSVLTTSTSGDAGHSVGPITLGSGSNIAATSLCSTTNCPAGTYHVSVFVDVTTACTTTGSYIVWLGWTDDAGAKTGSSTTTFFPIQGTGATTSTGSLALASTNNYGQADFILRTTGAATGGLGSINYGATATACGTGGPAVGKFYINVVQVG